MSVDRRGSCVPRSLDSIILDHQSFIEAGGNLKEPSGITTVSMILSLTFHYLRYGHKCIYKYLNDLRIKNI